MLVAYGRAAKASGEWTHSRSGGDAVLAAAGPAWPKLASLAETRVPKQPWLTTTDARSKTLAHSLLERAGRAHRGEVKAWAYSADGHWFVTSGDDGSTRLWLVETSDLVAAACRRIGRNLSEDEWRRHLDDEPYRETCPHLPGGS